MSKQIIYSADKYNRMSHPQNAERSYAIEVEGRIMHVRAANRRGAEILAQKDYDAAIAAECGPRWGR